MNSGFTASSRTPPADIRRALRKEVGFGCPECRLPFLMFHHFDPPWAVGRIHRIEGMIALCPTCHSHADGGAYTVDQLRQMKMSPPSTPPAGRLPWRPRSAVIAIGRNFFITGINKTFSVRVAGVRAFSLSPDARGNLLVSMQAWDGNGERLLQIENNDITYIASHVGDISFSARANHLMVCGYNDLVHLKVYYQLENEHKVVRRIVRDMMDSRSAAAKLPRLFEACAIECVRSCRGSDGNVQVLNIELCLTGKSGNLRATQKYVEFDMSGVGYDRPRLEGKCAGTNHITIVYGQEEALHLGSEDVPLG